MSFLGIANTLLLGTGRILNKYHSKTLHSIYDFKSKSMMLSANPSVGDLVEGEIYKSDDRIDSPLIFLKVCLYYVCYVQNGYLNIFCATVWWYLDKV